MQWCRRVWAKMTKLFGAVVGFLSFFQTRPTDKAKVGGKINLSILANDTFFAEHRSTTAYLDSTTTSQLDSFSWPQACSGTFHFCLAFINSYMHLSASTICLGKQSFAVGRKGQKWPRPQMQSHSIAGFLEPILVRISNLYLCLYLKKMSWCTDEKKLTILKR